MHFPARASINPRSENRTFPTLPRRTSSSAVAFEFSRFFQVVPSFWRVLASVVRAGRRLGRRPPTHWRWRTERSGVATRNAQVELGPGALNWGQVLPIGGSCCVWAFLVVLELIFEGFDRVFSVETMYFVYNRLVQRAKLDPSARAHDPHFSHSFWYSI